MELIPKLKISILNLCFESLGKKI